MLKRATIISLIIVLIPACSNAIQYVSAPLEGHSDFNWGESDQNIVIQNSITVPLREQYTDFIGNGEYDQFLVSEPFDDWDADGLWDCCLSESFSDTSGNGLWEPGEPFWDDWNSNNRYDAGEWDVVTKVRAG